MSTVTIYVDTPTGPARIRLPDDLEMRDLAGPLAARAGIDAPFTRLRHDTVGLLDPAATLAGLGLGNGTELRVVVAPNPTPHPPPDDEPTVRHPVPMTALGWVGAHGGAGTSTLAGLLGGDDHHTTPRPATAATVIVARTHATGLQHAQRVARDWPAHLGTPRGLVLIADTPGRLPRPLRELRHLIAGAYPQTWHIPWIEPLRRGDPPPPIPALAQLARDLDLPAPHPT